MDTQDGTAAPAAGRSKPLLLVSIGLLIATALVAGFFAVSWWFAAHDDDLAFSRTREDVNRAASVSVANVITHDSSKVDESMARLQDTFGGDLLKKLQQNPDVFRKDIQDVKGRLDFHVLDSVVTSLDRRAGTASAFVAGEVIVTPQGGQPQPAMVSLSRVTMQLVGNAWKLTSYEPAVPGAS